jgi:hypothetical protein
MTEAIEGKNAAEETEGTREDRGPSKGLNGVDGAEDHEADRGPSRWLRAIERT